MSSLDKILASSGLSLLTMTQQISDNLLRSTRFPESTRRIFPLQFNSDYKHQIAMKNGILHSCDDGKESGTYVILKLCV